MTGKGACNGAQTLLCKREGEPIESHDSTAKESRESALPHQVHLEPPRKATSHRELASRTLSHAPTTTLLASATTTPPDYSSGGVGASM